MPATGPQRTMALGPGGRLAGHAVTVDEAIPPAPPSGKGIRALLVNAPHAAICWRHRPLTITSGRLLARLGPPFGCPWDALASAPALPALPSIPVLQQATTGHRAAASK